MVDGLRYRIQPWPNPLIAVFMNKAKLYRGNPTRETSGYWSDSKFECAKKREEGVAIDVFDSCIPDRVDIKRAIPGRYFPSEFEDFFAALWQNIETALR
jgi:hypothetical protein